MFADVILPLPLEDIFTYTLPPTLAPRAQVGSRVIVPFGHRKMYTAVVLRIHDCEPQDYEVKPVMEVLDEVPAVLPSQLKLWKWVSQYYLCSLGEVYKAAIPSGMKLESESVVSLNADFESAVSLRPAEEQVLEALEQKNSQRISQLEKATGLTSLLPVVRRLLEMGAVAVTEEVQRTYKPRFRHCVRLCSTYFDEQQLAQVMDALEQRSFRQHQLLACYLRLSRAATAIKLANASLLEEVTKAQLLHECGETVAVCNALLQKGVLEAYDVPQTRLAHDVGHAAVLRHPLSPAQEEAMQQVLRQWQSHRTVLLHGVTGSGKTEIYIQLIQRALDQGRQVLYLLPEIVLTTQLTDRLRRVFGNRLGVYHSKYPEAERVEVYQKMRSSRPYDLLVGVRSSLFLPFQRLGLVIVDEEHETSFKQQDPAPRYHARNAALVLAAQAGALALLGSATPSLESYSNALNGKYGLVTLSTRFRDVELPRIEVVDIRDLKRRHLMTGLLSPRLLEAVRQALEQRQQAILFQNRRGYAPQMECSECGWVPRCQNCDVSLTLHRQGGRLVCHYCGATYVVPVTCPNCGSTRLRSQGYGTERIEDLIRQALPQARVERMDLDTTRSRQQYERIIHEFQQGKTDILVGTQMVTKGLDFDRVRVVGILNVDTMLNQPDFRSHERAYQLMEQVAGRAGRRGEQGLVILQARDADAPVIRHVVAHDYVRLFHEQMQERELFLFPPFCRIIYVFLKHRQESVVEHMAQEMATLMRRVFGARVFGPDTPHVSRVQLLYVRKMMLKVELQADLVQVRDRLQQIRVFILSREGYRSAQVYFDVE